MENFYVLMQTYHEPKFNWLEKYFVENEKKLTRDGPTPTNISRNSEPETVINGTPASPAVAFANRVLPKYIQ